MWHTRSEVKEAAGKRWMPGLHEVPIFGGQPNRPNEMSQIPGQRLRFAGGRMHDCVFPFCTPFSGFLHWHGGLQVGMIVPFLHPRFFLFCQTESYRYSSTLKYVWTPRLTSMKTRALRWGVAVACWLRANGSYTSQPALARACSKSGRTCCFIHEAKPSGDAR